jgi:outer membrane protein
MKRAVIACVAVAAISAGLASAQTAPFKVGVFDAQRISEETAEGKRIQGQLSGFRDRKQAELQAKEKEVSELQAQLTSQSLSLSQEKRATLEKDVQRKALDLNQAREAAGREMQLEVNEAQSKFQAQLLAVVEQFGREEGFTVVLEKSLVAYSDAAVDITTALVDRFNKVVPATAPPPAAAKPKPPAKP